MDPKMDSGILLPGDTLDSDYDVSTDLLPTEVIGIMDQLLCFETAWHQGWPLSQTLFTSLHIDNLLSHNQTHNNVPLFPPTKVSLPPSDILQIVLRAYCFGVVKSCDMVIELIVSQHYYEDEDFVSQTYNRGLLTDVPDDTCVDMLVSACEWVEAQEKGNSDTLVQVLVPILGGLKTSRPVLMIPSHWSRSRPCHNRPLEVKAGIPPGLFTPSS